MREPDGTWLLTPLSAEAAESYADEMLNGARPFANDNLEWLPVDALLVMVEEALPGLRALGRQFESRFGEMAHVRYAEFLDHTADSADAFLLRPESLDVARAMAREWAGKVHAYLAVLADVTGSDEAAARVRAVVVAAAKAEYERLDSLAGEARELAETDLEDWAFDLPD
jgi:hypothetical protein